MPSEQRVSHRPDLRYIDDFATGEEIAYLMDVALAVSEADTDETINHDDTGFSFEMRIGEDPMLVALAERIMDAAGVRDEQPFSFRYRHYSPGEGHPPHRDIYEYDGRKLTTTAMLHLVDTQEGGETAFPDAQPGPVTVKPRAGRLVLWRNLLPSGEEDPNALHEGRTVIDGDKMTVTLFIYC